MYDLDSTDRGIRRKLSFSEISFLLQNLVDDLWRLLSPRWQGKQSTKARPRGTRKAVGRSSKQITLGRTHGGKESNHAVCSVLCCPSNHAVFIVLLFFRETSRHQQPRKKNKGALGKVIFFKQLHSIILFSPALVQGTWCVTRTSTVLLTSLKITTVHGNSIPVKKRGKEGQILKLFNRPKCPLS